MFTLGLDSQFGTVQGVIQAAVDLKIFPDTVRKEFQTGAICLILCLMSMMFAHNAGNYVFTIYDNFCGSIPLLVIALFECVGVSYFYGLQRFSEDIQLMTGTRPGLFLCICWKYISPAIMVVILVSFFIKMFQGGLEYEAWDAESGSAVSLAWPWWCYILIALLIGMSLVWIPVVALLQACGLTILRKEKPAWFPVCELREDNNVEPHEISALEKVLLGWREDGGEGVCCVSAFPEEEEEEEPPSHPV